MKVPGSGESKEPYHPARNVEVREHLANERTLLAWVRTGVGLISVGFVIERAGALTADNPAGREAAQTSELFGLALVALGCLTLVVGAVQFFRNRRMIMVGAFTARSAPYMVVVVGSLLLAGAFIEYTVLR
jgi:putative membrane protein